MAYLLNCSNQRCSHHSSLSSVRLSTTSSATVCLATTTLTMSTASTWTCTRSVSMVGEGLVETNVLCIRFFFCYGFFFLLQLTHQYSYWAILTQKLKNVYIFFLCSKYKVHTNRPYIDKLMTIFNIIEEIKMRYIPYIRVVYIIFRLS